MPTPLGHAHTLGQVWDDYHAFAYNIHSERLAWRWYADKIHQLSLIVVQQLRDSICLLLLAGTLASYNSHTRHRRAWLRKIYGPPMRIRKKRAPRRSRGPLKNLKLPILTQPR